MFFHVILTKKKIIKYVAEVDELKNMANVLQSQVSHVGSLLIRELKRKDVLSSRQETHCSILSAILQAKSDKTSKSDLFTK